MARPKDNTYATDEELAWFKLENYEGLKAKAEDGSPNYQLWVSVVRDRVEVKRFIDAKQIEYIKPQFERLQLNPLESLGFDQGYSGAKHATNTPTIKMLTSNRVKWLNDSMVRSEAGEKAIVDDQLLKVGEGFFDDYAHLMINIRADDKQIKANFEQWLKAYRAHTTKVERRNYENKFASWINTRLVPYMDLELFSLLTGKSIDNERKFGKLLGIGDAEVEAQRRRLQGLKDEIFTDQVAKIIKHMYEEQSEQRGIIPT